MQLNKGRFASKYRVPLFFSPPPSLPGPSIFLQKRPTHVLRSKSVAAAEHRRVEADATAVRALTHGASIAPENDDPPETADLGRLSGVATNAIVEGAIRHDATATATAKVTPFMVGTTATVMW